MTDEALLEKPQVRSVRTDGQDRLPRYLSVKQLAELLHINEKKVYQLAGEGEIPCTKVTGKWIFPTQLIENWIFENSHGGVMTDRLVIAGSEDVLVQRTCNRVALQLQDSALISYCPCGTRHGLRMLETGRADASIIHWGATEKQALRHLGLLRGYRNHRNWVIARLLQRTQGLALAHDYPEGRSSIGDLLASPALRWAFRESITGSTRLLQDLCSAHNTDINRLNSTLVTDSERSAASAVSTGLADITCCTQGVAHEYNLQFVPAASVTLDLVMSRQTYFRTLLQSVLRHFREEVTLQDAEQLGGYQVFDEIELLTVQS
ncbi:MAG: helix-turn-helix transcriptional regulator [Gammaproteobacteria bacterium]|nr:helix-turn-helix transcriptional regulator [Gammaproteobacteria bacterium]